MTVKLGDDNQTNATKPMFDRKLKGCITFLARRCRGCDESIPLILRSRWCSKRCKRENK